MQKSPARQESCGDVERRARERWIPSQEASELDAFAEVAAAPEDFPAESEDFEDELSEEPEESPPPEDAPDESERESLR